uniref:BTB domain-containing protein n=1 Tax=Panagrellus redivivus TaxID=6233 RepID=A0A7E4VUZ2_PANRE
MLAVQQRFAYNDIKSVTLEEADLEEKSVGQFLESPKFDVPNSGGLKWWIRVYPAGETAAHRDSMGVFLNVNQSVKANMRFLIEGSTIQKSGTREFPNPPVGWGFAEYASHDQLSALLFRKSKLTITCIVEFDITQRRDSSVPLNYQLFRHVPTDVDLVMGSDRVPAHNGFLSLISPAFNAMFSHDNVESRLKKVEITDFDITTVKSVVDYCYGRELQNPSVETAVNILRFCDKYFITAAIVSFSLLSGTVRLIDAQLCRKNSKNCLH